MSNSSSSSDSAQQQQSAAHNGLAVRLRGLPFTSTTADVQQFFSGFKVQECLLCTRDGRNTGEAYAILGSSEQVASALAQLNQCYMGNRYIEIFEASDNELQTARNVQAAEAATAGYVVRLRGLPFSATTSDVLDFLGNPDVADMDDPLVFTYTYDGRPTGEAYIALGSQAAQQAALGKHKQLMGPRYIEVFAATISDVGQAKRDMLVNAQQSARRMQWAAAAASGRPVLMTPGGMLAGPMPDQMSMGPGLYGVNPAAAATGMGMPGALMNPLGGMGPHMAPIQGLSPYKPYRLPLPPSMQQARRPFAFMPMQPVMHRPMVPGPAAPPGQPPGPSGMDGLRPAYDQSYSQQPPPVPQQQQYHHQQQQQYQQQPLQAGDAGRGIRGPPQQQPEAFRGPPAGLGYMRGGLGPMAPHGAGYAPLGPHPAGRPRVVPVVASSRPQPQHTGPPEGAAAGSSSSSSGRPPPAGSGEWVSSSQDVRNAA